MKLTLVRKNQTDPDQTRRKIRQINQDPDQKKNPTDESRPRLQDKIDPIVESRPKTLLETRRPDTSQGKQRPPW